MTTTTTTTTMTTTMTTLMMTTTSARPPVGAGLAPARPPVGAGLAPARILRRHLSTALLILAATACTSPPPPNDAALDDAPPPRDLLEDDGIDTTRDDACPASSAYVVTLRARVLDEAGAGLAAAAVQLCTETHDARTFCLAPSFSDVDGYVTVDVAESARCIHHATARVLVPGSSRPAVYCDVPLPLDDASVTVAEPYVLVDGRSDLDGVTVDVSLDEPERLAARVLTPAQAPMCVQEGLPSDDAVVVAFAPDEDVDALFAIDVAGRQDGPIEVWARGALSCTVDDGTNLAKGEWTRLADGVVSDGVATGALPCLAWLALR